MQVSTSPWCMYSLGWAQLLQVWKQLLDLCTTLLQKKVKIVQRIAYRIGKVEPSSTFAMGQFTDRERKIVWQSATTFVQCENLSALRSHLAGFCVELVSAQRQTEYGLRAYKVRVV